MRTRAPLLETGMSKSVGLAVDASATINEGSAAETALLHGGCNDAEIKVDVKRGNTKAVDVATRCITAKRRSMASKMTHAK